MAGIARAFLRSILKAVNLIMGVVGIAIFLYGIWLAIVWQRDIEGSSFGDLDSSAPWFVFTSLCVGIIFCLVTCLGHISADISSGFCLTCYGVTVFVLVLLEAAIAADVLLNSDWEKGSSILLALALTALGQKCESNYDSDDEYPPARLPLMNHNQSSQPQMCTLDDPYFTYQNNTWMREANAFWT